MSIAALSWALKQKVGRATSKFVLVALANYANEDGLCYPSHARLEEDTEQDRKTIMDNLAHLQEIGLLEDTGQKVGRTGRVTVYKLLCRMVPKTAPLNGPVFPSNGPVFPVQWSQKRDTDPSVDPSGTSQGGLGADEQNLPPKVLTLARVAVMLLNETAGRKFRESGDNLLYVARRLMEEGVDIEGVKTMIQRQVKMWGPRPDMAQHLTPHTLFGPNFSKYYDDREMPLPSVDDKGRPREKTQAEINRDRRRKELDRISGL